MYITINDVIGEKGIDLSYPIHSTAGCGKEVAVIRMLSDNVQYQILKLRSVIGPQGPGPYRVPMYSILAQRK